MGNHAYAFDSVLLLLVNSINLLALSQEKVEIAKPVIDIFFVLNEGFMFPGCMAF